MMKIVTILFLATLSCVTATAQQPDGNKGPDDKSAPPEWYPEYMDDFVSRYSPGDTELTETMILKYICEGDHIHGLKVYINPGNYIPSSCHENIFITGRIWTEGRSLTLKMLSSSGMVPVSLLMFYENGTYATGLSHPRFTIIPDPEKQVTGNYRFDPESRTLQFSGEDNISGVWNIAYFVAKKGAHVRQSEELLVLYKSFTFEGNDYLSWRIYVSSESL